MKPFKRIRQDTRDERERHKIELDNDSGYNRVLLYMVFWFTEKGGGKRNKRGIGWGDDIEASRMLVRLRLRGTGTIGGDGM